MIDCVFALVFLRSCVLAFVFALVLLCFVCLMFVRLCGCVFAFVCSCVLVFRFCLVVSKFWRDHSKLLQLLKEEFLLFGVFINFFVLLLT